MTVMNAHCPPSPQTLYMTNLVVGALVVVDTVPWPGENVVSEKDLVAACLGWTERDKKFDCMLMVSVNDRCVCMSSSVL